MTDYFAVLDQPRRPWLDQDELKQAYHRLTLAAHPDTQHGSDSHISAATVNEAYRVLKNPKLRIAHLLVVEGDELDNANAPVPADIADVFWDAGNLSKDVDRLLQDAETTTSALAKALLKQRAADARERVDVIVARLETLFDESLRNIRAIDARWDGQRDLPALREIRTRLSYITRWLEQFREKQFQLHQL